MKNFISEPRCLIIAALLVTQYTVMPVTYAARGLNSYELLRDTPFENFEKDDAKLFDAAAHKALNETSENTTVNWENPQTGNSGEITVLKAFESKERQCKLLQITTTAKRKTATSNVNFCMIEGTWKLLSKSQLQE